MYDKILIPTDGSEQAMNAVEEGIRLASAVGAHVHVLTVIEVEDGFFAPSTNEEVIQEAKEQCQRWVDEVAEVADDAGLITITAVETSKAARAHERIVEYVDSEDVDFVVMGSTGRSNLGNLFLGSTAERVIGEVDVPVAVVNKPPADRLQLVEWKLQNDEIIHGS